MEIKQKLQELGLPVEFAESSFAATIQLLELDKSKENKQYFEAYGVNITKASELKYLACNQQEIEEILKRMQFCKESGIPLVDEFGNNTDYVFNKSRWEELYSEADLTNVIPDIFRDKEMLNEDILSTLKMDVTVGLTENTYDKYIDLEGKLSLVMQAIYGYSGISPEVSNNLVKLISANGNYSDEEILLAVLIYNQNKSAEEIEFIKNSISDVMKSLTQGGSRAV